MARRRVTITLDVYLNGRLVGKLTRAASGAVDFAYADEWLGWDHAFGISLSLPLRSERYRGDSVTAVFDNLLPDDDQVRRRLAARARADGSDAFSLLAAIGRDCVGALQFLPEGMAAAPAGVVSADELSESEIAALLRDLQPAPLGVDVNRDFRISLAGAQEKTALLYHEGRWKMPLGATATTHILKPQIGERSGLDFSRSVENEHLCAELMRALGMPCAQTSIADFEDQRVLVVERFDRHWTGDGRLLRVPQEDFCQALGVPPTRRYQSDGGPGVLQVLELLRTANEPAHDQGQFLKAQMVFWLLGATDGHAKNFSIHLGPGAGFRMTPLYDVLSVQPLADAGQLRRRDMKMAMALGDNAHYRVDEITLRHFEQSAAKARLPKSLLAQTTESLLTDLPAALDTVGNALPHVISEPLFESIAAGARGRLERLRH